ncbi:hypothetical protein JT359_19925 [Candidatus Poribacteria bacterium]|nr:hypothetical protein [Candidatus Poribacteria bacterium]
MKRNPLKLSLIGGGITFLCFFLPWMKYDFSSFPNFSSFPSRNAPNLQETGYILGIQKVINGATFDTLTFLATLAIIGVCFYMHKQQTPWKARTPVLICSGCGVIYYFSSIILAIIGSISIKSKTLEFAQETGIDIGNVFSLQFGIYGVLIGFVLALIGAWKIPKSVTSIDENEQTE